MEGEINLNMDLDYWNDLKSSNIAYLTIFDNDMQTLLSKLTQSSDDDETVDSMAE